MRVSVRRSEIWGRVEAPPSKSYTHRAVVCASMARGETRIISPLTSDDTEATLDVVGNLGVQVRLDSQEWAIRGREMKEPQADLFCRESGTTLRFMTAICSILRGRSRLTAGSSLRRRPIRPLVDALRTLGVDCHCDGEFPPVIVNGGLRGGKTEIRGDISSQFVSAVLLVSCMAEEPVTLRLTTPLESRSYVLMTMDTQRRFGVEVEGSENLSLYRVERQEYVPTEYKVEGDWSSAAFLLAAGAIAGTVEVRNLNPSSLQADRKMLELLEAMGAGVTVRRGVIRVSRADLEPLSTDVSDCPDLFPTLAVLCSLTRGKSVIHGIRRLRLKESDRVDAMTDGLRRAGVAISPQEDEVVIVGGQPKAAVIDPRDDHRIAMAFGLLGLACERVIVEDAECVEKSYPLFWSDLTSLGGRVEVES